MFRLSRFFRKAESAPQPLTGAPAVRRQKTYSAESGYVYQYFYEGRRRYEGLDGQGEEFVFQTTADRKSLFPVSIFLPDAVITTWERDQRRGLLPKERHGIAKLLLFRAFDGLDSPTAVAAGAIADAAALDEIAEILGFTGNARA